MEQSQSLLEKDLPYGTKPNSIGSKFAGWNESDIKRNQIQAGWGRRRSPGRAGTNSMGRSQSPGREQSLSKSRVGIIPERIKGENYHWAIQGREQSTSHSREGTISEPIKGGNSLWANRGWGTISTPLSPDLIFLHMDVNFIAIW